MLTDVAESAPLGALDPRTVTQRPTTTPVDVADSTFVNVVDDVVEISTLAGAASVPTLDVPLEPMTRPMPFTVTVEVEVVVTLPEADAREKLPPPNPPPPNPPPPPPPRRAPKPPAAELIGQVEPVPLMVIVRAAIGPAAEALDGGVPVTEMQEPTVTSSSVPDTVWVKMVAASHETDVVPENWLWTCIVEPDTEVTDPEATGRAPGAVVEEPDEADDGDVVEDDVLLQAALSTPIATTRRPNRPAPWPTPPRGREDRTVMTPPLSSPRGGSHRRDGRHL